MKDREGYRNISRDWIQGWGQGLALAFLSGLLVTDTEKTASLQDSASQKKEVSNEN